MSKHKMSYCRTAKACQLSRKQGQLRELIRFSNGLIELEDVFTQYVRALTKYPDDPVLIHDLNVVKALIQVAAKDEALS